MRNQLFSILVLASVSAVSSANFADFEGQGFVDLQQVGTQDGIVFDSSYDAFLDNLAGGGYLVYNTPSFKTATSSQSEVSTFSLPVGFTGGSLKYAYDHTFYGGADTDAIVEVLDSSSNVLSSVSVGKTTGAYTANMTWETLNLSFSGVGTTVRITQPAARYFVMDNVQLQAVPEPASMIALGIGAFGILRRRKSN